MTATLPCRCGVEGGTTRSSVRNSVLQRLVTHIIRLRVGVLVSERGPRLIVINGVTDWGRKWVIERKQRRRDDTAFQIWNIWKSFDGGVATVCMTCQRLIHRTDPHGRWTARL
jgi:hypothetical protein